MGNTRRRTRRRKLRRRRRRKRVQAQDQVRRVFWRSPTRRGCRGGTTRREFRVLHLSRPPQGHGAQLRARLVRYVRGARAVVSRVLPRHHRAHSPVHVVPGIYNDASNDFSTKVSNHNDLLVSMKKKEANVTKYKSLSLLIKRRPTRALAPPMRNPPTGEGS